MSQLLKSIISHILLHPSLQQHQQHHQQHHHQKILSLPHYGDTKKTIQITHSFFSQIHLKLLSLASYFLSPEEEGEGGGRGEEEGEEEKEEEEEKDEIENMVFSGYRNFFLPLWERFTDPCERRRGKGKGKREEKRGGKHTCTMKEPSSFESFVYIRGLLREELERIDEGEDFIIGPSVSPSSSLLSPPSSPLLSSPSLPLPQKMGGGAVEDLFKWMVGEGKEEGEEVFLREKRRDKGSPRLKLVDGEKYGLGTLSLSSLPSLPSPSSPSSWGGASSPLTDFVI